MARTRSPTFTFARCAGDPGLMSVTTNAPCDEPNVNLVRILKFKFYSFYPYR